MNDAGTAPTEAGNLLQEMLDISDALEHDVARPFAVDLRLTQARSEMPANYCPDLGTSPTSAVVRHPGRCSGRRR